MSDSAKLRRGGDDRPSPSRPSGLVKRYGDREALRGVSLSAETAASWWRSSARTAPARPRCCRSWPASSSPTGAAITVAPAGSAGCRSRPPSTASSRSRRTSRCSRGSSAARIPARPSSACSSSTDLRERAGDQVGTLSGGNKQRVNIAIGLLAEPEVLLLDEPSAALDPRQRARLWEFILRLAGEGTTVIYATHNIQEADRYANQLIVLADGELLFDGAPRELEREVGHHGPRLRGGLRRVPPPARPLMRWLLLKDLQHPAPLAAARGAARALPDRDRGADRLRAVARAGQAGGGLLQRAARASPPWSSSAASGSTSRRRAQRLFDAIDPVRVDSREEAIQKVEDGEVLGRADHPERPRDEHPVRRSSRARVEVYYNAEDPAKRQFVENTIKAQVQAANAALTKRVAKEALELLDLISTGGEYSLPRAGLRRARPRARRADPRARRGRSCRPARPSAPSSTA